MSIVDGIRSTVIIESPKRIPLKKMLALDEMALVIVLNFLLNIGL
jgi:hypothetical protein